MLATLQWYILREMSKTFLLTAAGLTAVLGLGGGAMNLIEIEQVSTSQLLNLMFLVIPVAGTLTIPVAALYSATVTFGRLSADNELLACRASGINLGWLLWAPVAIGVLSAATTFYFTSFMIPGLRHDLNSFARTGIRQFVEQQVRSPGRLSLPGGNIRIYADQLARTPENEDGVVLRGFVFAEFGKGGWRKIGTGESIVLRFDTNDLSSVPTLTGDLYNVVYYDRPGGKFADVGHIEVRPNKIPLHLRLKVKWLTLGELFSYRAHPERWDPVKAALGHLRAGIASERFYEAMAERFRSDGYLELTLPRGVVALRAERVTRDKDSDGRLLFSGVTIEDKRQNTLRTITGDDAVLAVGRPVEGESRRASLQVVGHVTISEKGATWKPIRKKRERIVGIDAPEAETASASEPPDASSLNADAGADWYPSEVSLRSKAIAERDQFLREVTSELHSRCAFSVSACVLVILGAALGTMFRGSQVMVAFGISFVPSLFVTVLNIMGRQLAEKPGTSLVGLMMIWGAIAVVGVLDVWCVRRVIRR